MDPRLIGIQKLFEFLGTIGTAVGGVLRRLLGIKFEGTIVLGLTPELEHLIRDILREGEPEREFADEEVTDYWVQAVSELVQHDTDKFQRLVDLGTSTVAIGAEAIIQPPEELSPRMAKIAGTYIKRYVIAPEGELDEQPKLLYSPLLADALAIAAEDSAYTNESPITHTLDAHHRVKPKIPTVKPKITRWP